MKTLVWLTHSFRIDSRLTSKLSGPCTFVYYSPYYFAGPREKKILRECSQSNLDAFYESLDYIKNELTMKGHTLQVFQETNPIEHINHLIAKYGFTRVVIDLPLFGMWKSTDPMEINVPFEFIDSDLIDDESPRMTAKSRWMSHVKQINNINWNRWNSEITILPISEISNEYPQYQKNSLIDGCSSLNRALSVAPQYGQTRNAHNGQTRLSTAFQNGTLDPHNTFFSIAKQFYDNGADFNINDGAHAAMLRQFAFREMTIMQTRRSTLTMEDGIEEWARAFLTEKSFHNLKERVNSDSQLTFDNIRNASTDDELINTILSESFQVGVMPNRARMFFAGWLFYNAPTGMNALRWLIDTFNLLLLDGQSPTNYTQSVSSMNLQYGKVMLLNRHTVKSLLNYTINA